MHAPKGIELLVIIVLYASAERVLLSSNTLTRDERERERLDRTNSLRAIAPQLQVTVHDVRMCISDSLIVRNQRALRAEGGVQDDK